MTRRRVAIALALWLLLSIELLRSDAQPSLLVLAAIIALIATGVFLAIDLSKEIVAVEWPTHSSHAPVDTSLQKRADRLRADASGAAGAYTTTLHDTLVALVDDRLLANHGVNRLADPQAANELLPASIQRLLDGPDRRTSSTNELSKLLRDIEEL